MTNHIDAVPDIPTEPRFDQDKVWESVRDAHRYEVHELMEHVLRVRNALFFDYRQRAGRGLEAADIHKDKIGFDEFDSCLLELAATWGWPSEAAENDAHEG